MSPALLFYTDSINYFLSIFCKISPQQSAEEKEGLLKWCIFYTLRNFFIELNIFLMRGFAKKVLFHLEQSFKSIEIP